MVKEKIEVFSIHTGMLSGQERTCNFLGTTGPPDIAEADKPRLGILPSLPYPLLHNSSQGEEATFLPSPQKSWLFAHLAQDGLNRCQCSKSETVHSRPPSLSFLLPPLVP